MAYEEARGIKGTKRGTALVPVQQVAKSGTRTKQRRQNAVVEVAADVKALVASAHTALEAGDADLAAALLRRAHLQAGTFCATIADANGHPMFAIKSLALSVHEALAQSADPSAVRPVGPTGLKLDVAKRFHMLVDALQWLMRWSGKTVKAGAICKGVAASVMECFNGGATDVALVCDKRTLVPPTKGSTQSARTGDISYGEAIEAAAQLRNPIHVDTDLPMHVVLSNRELRSELVEWLGAELLRTVKPPAGCTLVVETEKAIGANPPTADVSALANRLGEADGAMFVHADGKPWVVIASSDADTYCWGLLTLMRQADPVTGALPDGEWLVYFTTNEGTRRTVSLQALWKALQSTSVRLVRSWSWATAPHSPLCRRSAS